MLIDNEEALRKLYGWPKGRAKIKVLNQLDPISKYFLQKSPFFVLSTYDQQGRADASPRGGKPGFVHILDNHTLLVPDAKGNNRADSLVNIIQTEKLGCLFLIPGIDETLRINGNAHISTDDKYLCLFKQEQNPPISCIVIHVEEVFLHCAKALMRSKLWSDAYSQSHPEFPTMGAMLNKQLNTNTPEESQDEMINRYSKDL